MDSKSQKQKLKNPREGANYFSIATFMWILPVLRKCKNSIKNLDDFYGPLKNDSSMTLGDQLEREWNNELRNSEKQGRKPSFIRAFLLVHLTRTVLFGVLVSFIEFVLRLAAPLFLIPFIDYFDANGEVSDQIFKISAAGLIVCPFLMVFLINLYHLETFHIGMKLRVAVCSLIYRKILNLNKSELSGLSTGYVVNLMANDASRFDYIISFFHDIWIGPFQILVVFIFLWYYIGVSSIVGLFIILFGIPIAAWLGKISSRLRTRIVLKTDDRIHLMNEIIVGIQIIKLHVWEKSFEKLVALIRRHEIKVIKKLSYIKSIVFSLSMFHTRIAVFLTVLVYVLLGNEITASKVFVITSFFNVLHLTVTEYFTYGVSQVSEFIVSAKRIEKFLLHGHNSNRIPLQENISGVKQSHDASLKGIILTNVSVNWTKDHQSVLEDINFNVKPGELTAVIGPVGSGKTTLFYAILNELVITSGSIEISGSVSYASQEPWLFAATIKQNILFGYPYSEERFKKVIKVCALEKDIDGFVYKEETFVGERGVTLSGGQKARINLARAIYRDADIYLLDDPLSAVDVNVQKHLFTECISGLLKNKVVLLATHQLQFLNNTKKIVVLENRRIKKVGEYRELLVGGFDFSVLMEDKKDCKELNATEGESTNQTLSKVEETNFKPGNESELEVKEEIINENMKLNILWKYFTVGNKLHRLLLLLLLFVFSQSAATGGDYWISYWMVLEEKTLLKNESSTANHYLSMDILNGYLTRNICIYILAVFIFMNVVFTLFRSALFFSSCMKSSVILHDKTFKTVSRLPLHFFNENPSGRILNRFSKDIGNIDEILPSCMIDCLQIFTSAIGIFVVVPATNPWFLVPTTAVVILFYLLRQFYVTSACIIKRFEGTARSPIYTHLSASFLGLTTIRALKAESVLKQEFDRHQDIHTSIWFTFIAAVRAISLWLDIICATYNAVITLTFMHFGSLFYSGNVGLVITQTSKLTSSLQWGIRQSAEVENHMTSVERVWEYTNLKQEGPLHSGKKPNVSWPNLGTITFNKVFLKYNNSGPWVLNGISFMIQQNQKVGIVGRTGAGKSSLISALFRLFEIGSGTIEIDGLDISKVGLWDLRAKISVIPQDAILFTGTFRYNLDPFEKYSDEAIWKALEEVQLKSYIKELPGGLQTKVQERGSNLSVGQRQLVSLARAILHGNKILILDEATANVDLKTDALVQRTIRKKFNNCTVLTIAHRLNSIMDSDIVLVLDSGNLVEFAHPHLLLQNKYGIFYSLAEKSGYLSEFSKTAEKNYVMQ